MALPENVSAALPFAASQMVEGTINGFPFRTALEHDSGEGYFLRVNRALQAAAAVVDGEPVSMEITRLGEEPECRVPADLLDALLAAPSALHLWTEITPLARRDSILWIISAKQPETRRGRIAKACSMLDAGKRRPCCFGGLKWLVKAHPTTGGTWIDLPTGLPANTRRSDGFARSK